MNIPSLCLPLALCSSLATGCILTKDMDQEDTDDPSSTSAAGSDSATTAPGSDGGTTGMVGSNSATTAPGSDGGSTGMAGSDSATTAPGSGNTSDSSSAGDDESSLCESTGGIWDETSCGHYECGNPPDCAAIVPGCDCGPTMNFVDGMGCVEDPLCSQDMFPCGDALDCLEATQYCQILVPGVPGPSRPSYTCEPLPAACLGNGTCACLDGEGIPGLDGECTEPPGGGVEVEIYAP